MQKSEDNNTVNAGFFVRLIAYLVDLLIAGAALLVIRIPLWIVHLQFPNHFFFSPILFQFSLCDIVTYLAGTAYFILLTYYTGSTLGKKLLNLKVVTTDASRLTFGNVLYRETIGRYLSSLLFIGYIMVGASSEKRGFHDYLCDTKVIYTCRMEPQPPRYRPMPNYGAPYGTYAAPGVAPAGPWSAAPTSSSPEPAPSSAPTAPDETPPKETS